jgi:hypothetical protein
MVSVAVSVAIASPLRAQEAEESPPQHDMSHMQHDMAHMTHGSSDASPADREGSGTSWLPDDTPMYAIHGQASGWTFMTHGNVFLQYLHDSGARGSEQTGSVNWLMSMADHDAGGGRLRLRGMISLEPWTIGGCGYPSLLASGELCDGEPIHDRQHPHDLFMELAAAYDRPLGDRVHLQIYGGPVGEPALGPVAFMHRTSAMADPQAPTTHHWFDSTHIAYGVVTGGLYGRRWKAEASVFNGREPDDRRTDFDFGAMDSWSARVWFLPDRHWSLQASAGHLKDAELRHVDEPRVDVDRITASATYHRPIGEGGVWASTIGWGRNAEPSHDATDALLVESSLTLHDRDTVYGRFELGAKSSHDLDLPGDATFTVGKLAGGYTRFLANWAGLTPGVGAAASAAFVPSDLKTVYGSRVNAGVAIYVTLRPAAHGM